jgi:predicted AAA+ superfamily ATPase
MQDSLLSSIKENYRPRLVDQRLSELLGTFGGILITGPKWCGKSWTAVKACASAVFIDEGDNAARALVLPDSVLAGKTPRLIDEWQDAPPLWDAARRLVDVRRKPGQFIFTGSTTPPRQATSHSGTGRFARLHLRTLSLAESGDSSASVSLAALFEENGRFAPQPSSLDFRKALALVCAGGWPARLWLEGASSGIVAREYVKSIAETDISRADGVSRNPSLVSLFLRSLARNSATTVKATTLRRDIASLEPEGTISEQTVRAYAEALKSVFVLEEQPAWVPSLRSKKRVRLSPKLHFTDPSLAAAALGAGPKLLEQDIRTAGFLFETLCHRDLCVYASTLGGTVHHYQDDSGLEADAIVTLEDGRWGAFEVTLGTFEFDKAAACLLRLKDKLASEAPAPAFLCILTASGGVAQTRPDGVAVVPLDCLGA